MTNLTSRCFCCDVASSERDDDLERMVKDPTKTTCSQCASSPKKWQLHCIGQPTFNAVAEHTVEAFHNEFWALAIFGHQKFLLTSLGGFFDLGVLVCFLMCCRSCFLAAALDAVLLLLLLLVLLCCCFRCCFCCSVAAMLLRLLLLLLCCWFCFIAVVLDPFAVVLLLLPLPLSLL